MRSGRCILLTAIREISSGWREARSAAAAMRSRMAARFSAIDIGNHETTKGAKENLDLPFGEDISRGRKPFSLREKGGQECPPHTIFTSSIFTSSLPVGLVRSDRRRSRAAGGSAEAPVQS